MVYYLAIILVTAGYLDATGSNEFAFGLFVALFILKLVIIGPEEDPNG